MSLLASLWKFVLIPLSRILLTTAALFGCMEIVENLGKVAHCNEFTVRVITEELKKAHTA
jgi:hypothetical protein